jgi:hypothetical protein
MPQILSPPTHDDAALVAPAINLRRSTAIMTGQTMDLADGQSAAARSGLATPADLVAAAVKDVDIAQILVASGAVETLKIDQIEFGAATIGKLVIGGASADIHSGSAVLEGVHTDVQATLVVSVFVDMPWPIPNIDFDIHISLPSFSAPVVNADIPALQDIHVAIPDATAAGAQVQLAPVAGLNLGGASFRDARIDGTRLPTAGFGLSGLGLGALALSKLGVPAAATRSITLGEFKPNAALVLPAAEVTGVQVPTTQIPEIASAGAIDLPGVTVAPPPDSGGRGRVRVRVSFQATMSMHIERLKVRNLSLSIAADRVRLENLQLPLTVRGVTMGNIGLEQLTVNQISL